MPLLHDSPNFTHCTSCPLHSGQKEMHTVVEYSKVSWVPFPASCVLVCDSELATKKDKCMGQHVMHKQDVQQMSQGFRT